MANLIKKHSILLKISVSFLLPVFLITAVFALLGIYPFGEQSILSKDMFTQYVSYFSYYQNLFDLDGSSIFYSFSKLLGGDMFGFFAYYLMSPFNLVCLFFDKANLPVALLVITILKLGTAGLTTYLFLSRRNIQNTALTLALSTSYALMSYQIAFHINLMWLDCVLLAPLVIWGIEKLVQDKKWNLYIISLTAAIVSNYYIGFMLCLFSGIYFIYCCFLSNQKKIKQWKRPVKDFILASLLSGGLSAIIWLPTLLSLRGGIKSDFSLSSLRMSSDCDFFDLFSRIYMGSYTSGPFANKLPYIFCGIVVLFLVLHFFMNSGISSLRKYCAFFIISIFLASFYLEAFDLIWHGFSEPIGFPFRYSFLFCLFLIDLAHASAHELTETNSYYKNSKIILCVFIGITILVEKFDYEWLYTKIYCIELLILTVLIILLAPRLQKWRILIVGVVSLELLLNAFLMMRLFTYEPYEKYTGYVDSLGSIVDTIQFEESASGNADFYRMDKQLQMAANDPLLFDYAGVSHFSSTVVEKDLDLVQALGFERNTTYAYYNTGSTMAVDSLLGIKYIASYEPLYQSYSVPFALQEMFVNQNPFALPLGFLVTDQVQNNILFQEPLNTADLFQLQNELFSSLSGKYKEQNLLQKASAGTPVLNQLTLTDIQNGIYAKNTMDEAASLDYVVTATQTGPLYARFTSTELHRANIVVNGKSISHYFTEGDNGIILLGEFKTGEQINVQVVLMEDVLSLVTPYFYSLDINLLADYYNELSAQPFEITDYSDAHLTGTISSDGTKSHLLLTIPYGKGWSIKIDGKKVEAQKAFDSLLLIPVTQGTHSVELTYRPVGFYMGLSITLISLLFFFIHNKKNLLK